jgi:hypothetical protein
MILVHETFVCKPGNASKLAKIWKEAMSFDKRVLHILTDMTGQYHRVMMISQYDSMADFEKSWDEMKNPSPEMKAAMEKMQGMNDMYLSGGREIYKVW